MAELLNMNVKPGSVRGTPRIMKHLTLPVFVLCGTLALFHGCKRKAPEDGPAVSADRAPQAPSESGIEMVLLAGGRFTMGDKDEPDAKPHGVVLGPFYIDKYLVTQEQYESLCGENPSRWKASKNPVEQVRWSDAVRFCNKRSRLEGLEPCYDLETWQCNFDANGYRLPTEAEWEYACRAGSRTPYFFGTDDSKLSDY
ncbi:MAG: formylglycine-generating enzyme family protein, partial [Phycisphaerales bacterium]